MKKSISFRQYQGTIAKMYTSINSKVFLQYLAIDESPFYLIFFLHYYGISFLICIKFLVLGGFSNFIKNTFILK